MKLGLRLATTGGLTPIQKQANDFRTRVVADGGVFEAKSCLEAQLVILNNIV